jgi:hypothetical protein
MILLVYQLFELPFYILMLNQSKIKKLRFEIKYFQSAFLLKFLPKCIVRIHF